ncbi:serine/threonine-protein kinase pim-2-like [Hemibagrus wyckioides]|uniref:serine/threonine-protein kinase pim-2-like n=1 Tax=Hemibagrus wyckioides TaxID=337641 RepID=UPI00266B4753|nr:serine/threonine-protein kinase pim-2-like [Hemibagrus wyckioides]XP_058246855.1 serine/threonine-protein kinase pim-2-like [Hemibagrus wyckioides]XP_058246857.1 serine/threonine-protein kinase pim-2-like [Hemibagrus wyckioides]
MMDLVWDMDYHRSQDTAEMPVFTELQAEMWDLDSEADDTPMPEKFTTYQDIQSEDWDVDDEVQEVPTLHPACLEFLSDPKAQRFLDLYTIGNLLGSGGFGSVYEGVRRKDGQQVAIKHIRKDGSELYITAPGETCKLHLEVALMQMLSKPPHCQYVLQLVDWFEMDNSLLLVLERPIPCMDVYELLLSEGGTLSEVLAKMIMLQVVEAARYCQSRKVFHRDIKAENLLFNSDTLDIKLIDFGCGDLWQDTPYEEYAGTPDFWPPEWIQQQQYYADHATVWSLGILLYSLVCGEMPFSNEEEIVAGSLNFIPGLSESCRHLINWCLEQDPTKRPSLRQISKHGWFTEGLSDDE